MDADDILIAMLIAMAVLAIFCVCHFRLRPSDLDGFWATMDGDQYKIRAFPGGAISIEHPRFAARGKIRPLRGVCMGNGQKVTCGSLGLDGRWLQWDDGTLWVRQGRPLKSRFSEWGEPLAAAPLL